VFPLLALLSGREGGGLFGGGCVDMDKSLGFTDINYIRSTQRKPADDYPFEILHSESLGIARNPEYDRRYKKQYAYIFQQGADLYIVLFFFLHVLIALQMLLGFPCEKRDANHEHNSCDCIVHDHNNLPPV